MMFRSFSTDVAPKRLAGELPHIVMLVASGPWRFEGGPSGAALPSIPAWVPVQLRTFVRGLAGSGKSPPGFRARRCGGSGVRSRQASGPLRGSFPSAWRFQRSRIRPDPRA